MVSRSPHYILDVSVNRHGLTRAFTFSATLSYYYKNTLFSKFSGTTTAPTPGLQTTQQAFDKIIRDVAQAQQDPELQEAIHMNALFDAKKSSRPRKSHSSTCPASWSAAAMRKPKSQKKTVKLSQKTSMTWNTKTFAKKKQQGPHGPQGLRLRKNTTVISLLKHISALKQLLYKIVTLK